MFRGRSRNAVHGVESREDRKQLQKIEMLGDMLRLVRLEVDLGHQLSRQRLQQSLSSMRLTECCVPCQLVIANRLADLGLPKKYRATAFDSASASSIVSGEKVSHSIVRMRCTSRSERPVAKEDMSGKRDNAGIVCKHDQHRIEQASRAGE